MTELPTAGYVSIRDLIKSSATAPSQWDYIALVDDGGSEELRVSITGDSRAGWSEKDKDADTENETMVATIEVSGSDADITQPVTIVESRLYDVSSGGSPLSTDTFTGATIDEDSDDLKVEHEVEVPQVV